MNLEASRGEHLFQVVGENRAFVLGYPFGTVQERGGIPIEIHERILAIRIERHEAPTGL